MFSITIETGDVDRMLDDLARSQLPFATAKALTTLANEARGKIVDDLPGKYILRNTWWKPGGQFGFNVKTAKKTDWPDPVAEVYTRAQWMVLHEEGGVKLPTDGGSNITLPTTNVRRNKRDIIARANRPRGSSMTTAFKQTVGGGQYLVKPMKKENRLMYLLKPSARIPKSLKFEITVKELVERRWADVFNQALDDAIRTAR